LTGATSIHLAIRGGRVYVFRQMKQLMPGGGVAVIGTQRIVPAAPWLKSSRTSALEFWPNEFNYQFGASLEWTDKLGRSWNYTYRLWDSYYDAVNDAGFASAGGIDAVSGLGGGEFYNWILRATLVDKSPA